MKKHQIIQSVALLLIFLFVGALCAISQITLQGGRDAKSIPTPTGAATAISGVAAAVATATPLSAPAPVVYVQLACAINGTPMLPCPHDDAMPPLSVTVHQAQQWEIYGIGSSALPGTLVWSINGATPTVSTTIPYFFTSGTPTGNYTFFVLQSGYASNKLLVVVEP